MDLSVILPTHNPDMPRLERAFAGLRAQTLPTSQWEIVLVDNASSPPIDPAFASDTQVRIVREARLGLSAARRAGLRGSQGKIVVLVDDDNVLAPDYLQEVLASFARHPEVGALGGKSLPELAVPSASWQKEFFPLLALRDFGETEIVSNGLRPPGAQRNVYPVCAPIGAGMAIRREAAEEWLQHGSEGLTDRRGRELSSGGDNDMVFSLLRSGWEVAYVPKLQLLHLIPAGRLETGYLARLNRGIQKSWMQLLTIHEANPWPAIPAYTVPFRKMKAWFTHRAWAGPAASVRWQGACGHFEGRVTSRK